MLREMDEPQAYDQDERVDDTPMRTEESLLLKYLDATECACPACKYSLRGAQSAYCPECGEKLRLHITMETPNLGAWLLGMIGLSAGLGFSGMVLLWGSWMAFIRNRGGVDLGDLIVLAFQCIVTGALMWSWNNARLSIRRQDVGTRWMIGTLCWLD